MTSPRRLLRIGLAAAAIAIAVATAAVLSLPLWIDTDAVKRQIAAFVHQATGDSIEVERLRVSVIPPLSVQVDGPRYRKADTLDVVARQARIQLEFWPLLAGRARPNAIHLSGISARVRLPDAPADPKPLSAAQAEQALRDAIAQLRKIAPRMELILYDGKVVVQSPGRPDLTLENLRARIVTSSAGVALAAECRSAFWQRLAVDAAIGERDLAGRGHAEFVDLDVAGLADYAGQPDGPIAEARLLGSVDWRTQGLSRIQASTRLSTPRLVARAGGNALPLTGLVAAASLETRDGTLDLALERLYLQSPRLLLGGRLQRDGNGRYAFSIEGSDVALSDVQAVAAGLAPEASWVKKPPVVLHEGIVEGFEVHASADDLSGLFDPAALWGELRLRDVAVELVRPALRLTGIGGAVAFDRGQLEARGVTARLGDSRLSSGKLVADYLDKPALLRAQGAFDVDLSGAIDLARALATRQDLREHFDALEAVDGRAVGSFDLAGRRGALETTVQVSQLALFVRHRYVPLPLRFTEGSLRYSQGTIAARNLAGTLGRSSFAGLDASLQLADPNVFELHGREGNVALEEAFAALRRVAAAAPLFAEVGSLAGRLAYTDLQARGTLEAPGATQFQVALVPHAAKALLTRLDTDVLLDGGQIDITDRLLEVRDVGLETLDSKLRVSARAADYQAGPQSIDVQADGEVGGRTVARLEKEAKLPSALRIRAPLRLAGMSATWHRNGNAVVRGGIRFVGDTDVSIDARGSGDVLRIDRLSIRDRTSDALLSAQVAGFNIDTHFKGRLAGGSLANIFIEPPVAMQEIEGDLQALVHPGKPWISTARGRLSGRGIGLPAFDGQALGIERIVLAARGEGIRIEEAAVSHGENRFSLKGDVRREDDKLALDIALEADRIVIPAFLTHDSPKGENRALRVDALPVTGRIGLNIGHLQLERFTLAPLVVDARTAGNDLNLRVERAALCDIGMSGRLEGPLDALRLAGSLSARQADLEKSISCLTGGRVVGSGKFDLDAQFASTGTFGELARKLDGTFSAEARDGNIEQFDTLNRIFAFLNLTEVMRGQKLGMDSRGLPYRTATLTGGLAGAAVRLDEAVLDAATVHIAATGTIDYGADRLSMDVMVAPLQTANVILDKIPLVNRIFGGAVLALPVQVLGSPREPVVVPLGPGAVTRRMTSIIANTLKIPLDAVKSIAVGAGAASQ